MQRRSILQFLTGTTAVAVIAYFAVTSPTQANWRYPKPAGLPGAPFDDPNLKLVVLDALKVSGQIDLGTPRQFLSHVLGRRVDPYEAGFDLIQPAYDYLARYPLSQAELDAVETLSFDGGLDIYFYAWPQWHGETQEFDVASMAGITACRNLRSLEVASMVSHVDLALLVGLEKLETIDLGVRVSNVEALLEMPQLKSVSLLSDEVYADVQNPDHPTRRTFAMLKDRGVRVWVHWMTWVGEDRPPAFE